MRIFHAITCFTITAWQKVQSVSLEEALLTDIIGDLLLDNTSDNKCNPSSASGTFSFTYDLTEPYFDRLLSEREKELFFAEISHVDPISEQSWTIRVGKGGNIYSYRGPLGEVMPPNRKPGMFMVDEVWQSVAVDSRLNNATNNFPNGKFFIHQAGIYQKDSPYSDPPFFFSPTVAHVCDTTKRECIFASWGQVAAVPTKFVSKVLYISRYRDCGDGVLEFTSVVHNADNNLMADLVDYTIDHSEPTQFNYMSLPWWGVRDTVYRDVLMKQSAGAGGGHWTYFPNPRFGNPEGEQKMVDTGGYTIFAENRSPRPPFIFPGHSEDPTNAPDFVMANLAGNTVPCEPVRSQSFSLQAYHVRCRLMTEKSYTERCASCLLTFTNKQTGATLDVINVVHWSHLVTSGINAGHRFIYFAPKSGDIGMRWAWEEYDEAFAQSVADEVNAVLTEGSDFSVEWTDSGLTDADNACITLVHGTDPEVHLNAGTSYWNGYAKVQYGTTFSFERQYMVMNEVQYPKNLPGSTFGRNQYIITSKGIENSDSTASEWVGAAIQDFNEVGDLPGTQIDLVLSADGSRFGHSLNNVPCVGSARCIGSTTPQLEARIGHTVPHFLIICGAKTYFGPDVNHFSEFMEEGIIRTYVCDETNYTIRPTVKLLGFFAEGACVAFEAAVYQSDYCTTEGVPDITAQPSAVVSSPPTSTPTTTVAPTTKDKSSAPSQSPTLQHSVQPSSQKLSSAPSQSPTLHLSVQPSQPPIALPDTILSLNQQFNGYIRTYGSMFDVQAVTDITILTFEINAVPVSIAGIEIYTKLGTHRDSEKKPSDWVKICKTDIPIEGRRIANRIPIESVVPVNIPAGTLQAFYVTFIDQQKMKSYPSQRQKLEHGDLLAQDDNLKLFVGTDNFYYFSDRIFSPRSFNGNIVYSEGLTNIDYHEIGIVPDDSLKGFNIKKVIKKNYAMPETCKNPIKCSPESPWKNNKNKM